MKFLFLNSYLSKNCLFTFFQNANEDVVKMIIGNKCDMDDKRVISAEKGQEVSEKDLKISDLKH